MIKKISLITAILIFISASAYSQGILGLFGGSSEKKKYKVKFIDGDENAVEEILQIKIRGVIQEKSESDEMPFKIEKDMMEEIKKDLKLARERDAIKAILLDINSPGGEVTASDVIYHLIKKMKKETEKPVIALIGTMGASGAYYVACSADKILAHPTSIIGSIGVLMQSMNFEELAEKLGIKAVYMKSEKTPKKDLLSPFRPMTEAEKKMLLEIINGVYDRFVEIVSESRNKSKEEVIKIADGGIYNSSKALELGLIDEIGYQEDAIDVACKETGLESIALVKRISRKSFSEVLAEMTEMKSEIPSFLMGFKHMIESANVPQLMYKLSIP
ncbi:MAG: protease [Clostridiales bacterium]|nr:protease [Clostridiales bacterium]MDN5282876.1 protease [Candidatus Ozemobacter sp.]